MLAAFTERFVAATRRLAIGDPMDEATFIGPLVRPRGRDELHAHVLASIDAGARLLLGGIKRSGYGRELSWFGVREFANAKLIWTR